MSPEESLPRTQQEKWLSHHRVHVNCPPTLIGIGAETVALFAQRSYSEKGFSHTRGCAERTGARRDRISMRAEGSGDEL